MKLKFSLMTFFLLMFLAINVNAADFTSQGDIDLIGIYGIKNATNITAEFFCNDTDCYQMSDFISGASSGDITAVNTDGSYLSGGGITGAISLLLNTTALQSWASNLYCKLTGCTMTGDLNMGANNINNVSNITVEMVNATCCVYLGTIQATDGNSISVKPSGDEDNFLSFKTIANRPTIKIEGGKFMYMSSSNIYDMGISLRADDTYSGTLNYEKDGHIMTVLGKNSPVGIKTNSEYKNYFLFETYDHQPQISVFNGTKLLINDSLEVNGIVNASGKVYSEGVEVLTSETDPLWTANQSSYFTKANINSFGYYNSSNFVITDYFTKTQIENFGYYNSTDFSISDYATNVKVDSLGNFSAWDNFTGIPHATPTNGDTTHFSLADEIYDFVIALGYIASLVADTTPQLGGYLDANGQNIGSTTDEIENVYVGDNTRIYFGDGQDASIYYNTTHLVIG